MPTVAETAESPGTKSRSNKMRLRGRRRLTEAIGVTARGLRINYYTALDVY